MGTRVAATRVTGLLGLVPILLWKKISSSAMVAHTQSIWAEVRAWLRTRRVGPQSRALAGGRIRSSRSLAKLHRLK